MAKNNTVKQTIDVEFDVTGLEQIISQINKFNKGSKGYKGLIEFVGALKAMRSEISFLMNQGFASEASKLTSEANKAIGQFDKLLSIANKMQSTELANLPRKQKKNLKRNDLFAPKINEQLYLGLDSLSGGLARSRNENVTPITNKINAQEESAATKIKIRQNKELIAQLIKEKKIRETITSETKKPIAPTTTMIGRVRELAARFFSVESAISRVSFVLTAKLSYSMINILQRLPRQILSTFSEFEGELSKTFALMSNESSVAKLKMQNDIVDLSKQYGIAAKELSGAMYEIISAQVPLVHSSKVLEQAVKLSIGGAGDLRDAAKSLVQIINAYDIGFENAARVSDIMFQTVKYGQLTMQQYTEQMQKVVATASIFNISQEEISAAIATMTINGQGAEQAFTALNQMLMVIANPTKQAKDLMRELGISLTVQDIQEKGLGKALEELMPLMTMTGAAGEQLIATMFKTRTGFKAVASLLQNMDEYSENYGRMLDSAGATSDALSERMNTVEMATNKAKTAWDSFLMSFVDGKNRQTTIGFIQKITKLIDGLEKNISSVMLVIKMIFAQVGVFIAIGITKRIASIITTLGTLKISLSGIWASMKAGGDIAATAWAKATLGLSLLVQALINVVHWIGVLSQKKREADLKRIFNVDNATQSLNDANAAVEKLDNNISRLQGVKKMINMYDQLAQKQVKSNKEIMQMNSLFTNIESILNSAGIKIMGVGNKIQTLGKYIVDVDAKLAEFANRRMAERALSLGRESQIALSQYYQKEENKNPLNYQRVDIFGKGNVALKRGSATIDAISDKLVKGNVKGASGQAAALEKYLNEERTKLKNELEYIKKIEKEDKKTFKSKKMDKTREGVYDLIEGIDYLISYSMGMQNIYDEFTIGNIPEIKFEKYEGVVGDTGKSKQEKSYLGDVQGLMDSLFGDRIYETVDEIRAEIKNKVQEIRDKMSKDAGTILDKETTEALMKQYESLVDEDIFVQVFSAGQSAMKSILDGAKSLRASGDAAGAKTQIQRALDSYTNYAETISKLSDMTDQELISLGIDARDARTFMDEARKSTATFMLDLVNEMKESLSGDEFIKFALEQFSIDESIMKNWDTLSKALEDISGTGQNVKEEVLNAIREKMLDALSEQFKQILGIVEQPEFIKKAEEQLQKAISDELIKTPAELLDAINKLSDINLQTTGKSFTPEQSLYLSNLIKPEDVAEQELFDWKSALGIKDYKDGNDAIKDVMSQTVNELQNVWSFYWDWEIRKLQEQYDKKLEMMETEKKRMLANEYMSSEQAEIIAERFEERKRQMQDKMDKEMAAKKKKQALYNAGIDFARGLIGIWSSELSKGIFGLATAPILTAMLSSIFATQLALINNQKFASGGLTGSGYGSPDETGHKPAGIVHANELVIDKKTLDKNYNEITGMYSMLRSGHSFDSFISKYIAGNKMPTLARNMSNKYAQGGLVVPSRMNNNTENIVVDLVGLRTVDDISMAKLVYTGNKKWRLLNG